MKHRRFTEDFKREAVRRAQEPDVNKSELARSLEISSNILHRWVRESKQGASAASGRRGRRSSGSAVAAPQKTAAPSASVPQLAATNNNRPRGPGSNLQRELEDVNIERQMLKEALSFYIKAAA